MAIKTYNDQNFVAIANAIRSKNGETTQYKPSEMAAAISAIESAIEVLPQDTVSGAIANFPDGSNNYPVVELIANIDPKQAGSGDPSPSNVRPISGSTECNISKQGKNLLQNIKYQSASTRVNIGQSDDLFSIHLKAGTYTLSATSVINMRAYYRGENDSSNTLIWSVYGTSGSGTFTLSEDTNVRIWLYNGDGISDSDVLTFQLEAGSTATAYEPYSAPEVKSISWESEAGTVYGGTLNVTTGELTVNRAFASYNSSDGFATHSSDRWYHNGLPSGADTGTNKTLAICNQARYGDKSLTYGAWFAFGASGFYLNKQNSTETIEDLNTRLVSNPLTICYYLTTPVVYQLEPEEVKTLLGVNNIYADTGNVSVTYRADIDLYIAKKIAEGA